MPESPVDRRDLGGDPACWAHEFPLDATEVAASHIDDDTASQRRLSRTTVASIDMATDDVADPTS